jgi:hypothetical protein
MYAKTLATRGLSVIAACLLFCGSPLAADETSDIAVGTGGSDTSVPLVSGGIGDDELNYLKGIEHQYNLKVLFTESSGVFLSDLPVTILDKKGDTVVSTVTKGPILLVTLHPGTYTVTATEGGEEKREKVSVSGHGLHLLQFRFAGPDAKLDN